MTARRLPKAAGIDSSLPGPSHNPEPAPAAPSPRTGGAASAHQQATSPSVLDAGPLPATSTPYTVVQDRLAGWVSDLTTLHELTERLAHATTLDDALRELLRAGAALVGAQRGMAALEPADGLGPALTIGLGLGHAELGHIETIPRASGSVGRLLDGLPEPAAGANGGTRGAAGDPDTHTAPGAAGTHPTTGTRAAPGAPGTSPGAPTAVGSWPTEDAHPDIAGEDDLDPRHREVAARLGYAASYALPLEAREQQPTGYGSGSATDPATGDPATGTDTTAGAGPAADLDPTAGLAPATSPNPTAGARASRTLATVEPPAPPRGRLGAVVWLYDEPTEPTARQRHLVGLYTRYAAEHIARHVELHRDRRTVATLREELLPSRLPRVPGVRLAARHHTGPFGGGHWYDALALPDGALGLSIGGVTGGGPSAVAAMGRLRASLRAYAVLEGEDPVAVLSDLELLLRLTEPARAATALFAYCEPAHRTVVLAGAGHCPPLLIGAERTRYVETSLSAPLGMLACWEAPSVGVSPEPGDTLLLFSDGLLHRTGAPMDRAFAQVHAAAASVPKAALHDPDAVVDHVLRTVLARSDTGRGGPSGTSLTSGDEDIVLLAARFD
ncbi:SpoIIE family protein phosphatase [Streptomyces sp. HSW2009]|uniref:SpoIIE family protein phosphatase n=1 Tax=Streptomyces sp. HSW2009 TaxID=3142890 RepID=UPI0032F08079